MTQITLPSGLQVNCNEDDAEFFEQFTALGFTQAATPKREPTSFVGILACGAAIQDAYIERHVTWIPKHNFGF